MKKLFLIMVFITQISGLIAQNWTGVFCGDTNSHVEIQDFQFIDSLVTNLKEKISISDKCRFSLVEMRVVNLNYMTYNYYYLKGDTLYQNDIAIFSNVVNTEDRFLGFCDNKYYYNECYDNLGNTLHVLMFFRYKELYSCYYGSTDFRSNSDINVPIVAIYNSIINQK